jgi:hypothetical protein
LKKTIIAAVAVAALVGCAANSSTKLARGHAPIQPHNDPVCLLKHPLPSGIAHTIIGEVRGGKKTYGSMQEVLSVMGAEGRKVGADAIINVQTKHDINAFAWARPIGSGTGVKLANKSDIDCIKMGGEFR